MYCLSCGQSLSGFQAVKPTEAVQPAAVSDVPALPDGYAFHSSMSFKKGKLLIFINVFVLVALIAAIAVAAIVFPYDWSEPMETLTAILVALLFLLLILLAFGAVNMLIQMIFYKTGGGGKAKIHFGLMIEVYCEKVVSRNCYVLAQIVSNLLPIIILAVITVFVWTDYMFLSLCCCAANFLAYIPVYIYVLKHDKTALVHFYKGTLNIFTKI